MPRLDPPALERATRALGRRDRRLGALIRRVGPCRMRQSLGPYRSLLRSVIYQQLAGAAARAIDTRFRGHYGGRYPQPAELVATRDATLRRLGLSCQKSATLRNIARAYTEGGLSDRRLRRMDGDDVVTAVTAIHGIGEWTAHMLLMFSLGHPDVLPVGDYGVRKGVQVLYGLDALPGRDELESIGEPWRPYRTVASWYLWRQLEIETPG